MFSVVAVEPKDLADLKVDMRNTATSRTLTMMDWELVQYRYANFYYFSLPFFFIAKFDDFPFPFKIIVNTVRDVYLINRFCPSEMTVTSFLICGPVWLSLQIFLSEISSHRNGAFPVRIQTPHWALRFCRFFLFLFFSPLFFASFLHCEIWRFPFPF